MSDSVLWSLSCVGHTTWHSHTLLHEKARPAERLIKTDLLELSKILSTDSQTYHTPSISQLIAGQKMKSRKNKVS